ncbi:hypothetical protein OXPF_17980 [Oxobacter pfennigii]|uniref:Uncharacterized protein n=1 Tax=Oxobacter pfennigii TaxID=36849 RepID=A0A0N8NTF8_9CLOT|nr:DUF5661 family protein [Oxobacter pfennigii]KPU44712.1 hypothetical protein OXPF_17980 [Oxobacter pfennigii]
MSPYICPVYVNEMTRKYNCCKMPYPVPRFNSDEVKKSFTTEEAVELARMLDINFSKFDVEQFRMGLDVELEHGRRDPATNVTNDDPVMTAKIALAHLNEFSDYYSRLKKMEDEAKQYWGISGK